MRELDSPEPQLSDLKTVLAILEAGTVTRAAEHMGMSQSALSYQLDRMRSRFGDPLFVRVGSRMAPTPFARLLADPAARIMRIVGEIGGLAAFDPLTTTREFRIGLTELGAITALPTLVRRMAERAPRARLSPVNVDPATMLQALESGAMDIAAVSFPVPHDLLVRQRLYERDYVCVVRKDHPTIGDSMTMREFADTPRIETPVSLVARAWLEDEMSRMQLQTKVSMSTRHVAAIPFIVAACDCAAIIPREVFELFVPSSGIRAVALPIEIPPIQVYQYWHPCMGSDPAVTFFRELIFETAWG